MIKPYFVAGLSVALISLPVLLSAYPDALIPWQSNSTSDGTSITPRHETGSVVVNGDMYVLGGRGMRPVEVYRSGLNGWESLGATPLEIHHFQPVAVGTKIYAVGAMTCCYPNEPSVADIHVFDTADNTWSTEGVIPVERQRGGAGAVVYNDRIYVVGGNTLGHNGGSVAWFDEFDPVTGTWQTLPDAPNARDHFQAVIVGNQLIVTGGRQTDIPNPFDNTVAATDIYNFDTGVWRSGASIPTLRAGSPTVGFGTEVIVVGGEASGQSAAFDVVEAYDVATDSWRTLQPMIEGRHSGAGAILGDRLHVMAGSAGVGGAPEIATHESVSLVGGVQADTDVDNDGLSNLDEVTVHFTDAQLSDSDNDGLNDGAEVISYNTNPLLSDTDADGLSDGDEVNVHSTDPLVADSDSDGVNDGDEVNNQNTDPNDPTNPSLNPDGGATDGASDGSGDSGGSGDGGSTDGSGDGGSTDGGSTGSTTGGSDSGSNGGNQSTTKRGALSPLGMSLLLLLTGFLSVSRRRMK